MKLYHNPMSTCSQKVRLVLAEKKIEFESVVLDLQSGAQFDPGYLKLNPRAVVPTLIHEARSVTESTLINEYLEDCYPEPSLLPNTAIERYQMRAFCKQLDEVLHPACAVITYAIGARPGLLAKPKAEVDALINNIPDEARRTHRAMVIKEGIHAPIFTTALAQYLQILGRAEARLAQTPYLAGEQISLADYGLAPYLLRLEHLALDTVTDRYPGVKGWYHRIQQRASYQIAITNWLPKAAVAGFKAAGKAVIAEIRFPE
jgi:glutathione S-transferase